MCASLVEQARLAYRSGEPRRALELARTGLAADAAMLSARERSDLLVLKSHSLSALGQWKQAVAVLDLMPTGELGPEERTTVAMHKGYLLGSLAQYAECWSLLHQAEKEATSLGKPLLIAEVCWRRGMISVFAGEYSCAEKNLVSALRVAGEVNDRQLQALATAGLGKNLMYQREYPKAIARFEESLAIFQELNAAFYAATVRGELGTCYLHLGETGTALDLLEGSAAAFLENGSLSNYQVSLADIGSVYLARKEYAIAISYFQRALELARQLCDQLSVSKWLRNLASAYIQMGSPALAEGFEAEAEIITQGLSEERTRGARVAASLR